MICRYYKEGQVLDVADLNKITVLIDRSETALTEVGWNTWKADLIGPPHSHDQKEQIFYITDGHGTVGLGGTKHAIKPGSLVYVPAGTQHQTITTPDAPVSYMLFNFFLNEDKEGHASFADHISKVKHIRKQQAESGRRSETEHETAVRAEKPGKFLPDLNTGNLIETDLYTLTLLVEPDETERCAAAVASWIAGKRGTLEALNDQEQTFYVLSGKGAVTIDNDTRTIKAGDVVFIAADASITVEAGSEGLSYLRFITYLVTDKSVRSW